MSFSLPKVDIAPLKVGKMYQWVVSVVCDPEDSSKNVVAEGWVERVEPSPSLVEELEKASPRDRVLLYGKAGVWQETVTTLAELRRSHPEDPKIAADWEQLLSEVGLKAVATDPFVECCKANN